MHICTGPAAGYLNTCRKSVQKLVSSIKARAHVLSACVRACVYVFVDLIVSGIYFCELWVYMCGGTMHIIGVAQWETMAAIVLLYLTLFSQLLVACTLNLNIALPHLAPRLSSFITRHNNACMVRFVCVRLVLRWLQYYNIYWVWEQNILHLSKRPACTIVD